MLQVPTLKRTFLISLVTASILALPIAAESQAQVRPTTSSPSNASGNYRRADQFPSLAAACAALSGADGAVIVSTSVGVASNTTVPSNCALEFRAGANLNIASGQKVTFEGAITAGPFRIFTGAGSVSFGTYSSSVGHSSRLRQDYVLPEWWGAVPDNSTDSSKAIQAATDAAGISAIPVRFTGNYYVGKGDPAIIITHSGTQWHGIGYWSRSLLRYEGKGTAVRVYNPAGGNIFNVELKNIGIGGTAGVNSAVGISLESLSQFYFDNVSIGDGFGRTWAGFDKGVDLRKATLGTWNNPIVMGCKVGMNFDYESTTNVSILFLGGNFFNNNTMLRFVGASSIQFYGTWFEYGNELLQIDNSGTNPSGTLIESLVLDGVRFVNGAESPFQGGYVFRAIASSTRPVTIRGLTIRNAWLVLSSAAKATVVPAPLVFAVAKATSVDTAVPIEITNTVIRGGSTSLISSDSKDVNIVLRNGSYGKDSTMGGIYPESALFSGTGATSGIWENQLRGEFRSNGAAILSNGVQPSSSGTSITWFQKMTHRGLDLPPVSSGSCSNLTTESIVGAAPGDSCTVSAETPWGHGTFLVCTVSSANTVQWQACNFSGATVHHPSDAYTIRVLR